MKFIKKMGSLAAAVIMMASMPCIAAFAAAEQDGTGLWINEVCTQNKSSFTDSLGKASDWIELYNGGSEDIDLSGFGLSDSADAPMKFVFPSGTVIKKGEHLLLAASKDQLTELNTGFALSKSGEALVLSASDGTMLQTVEVPALAEDTTYGRTPDGGSSFAVMAPTPAARAFTAQTA